MKDFSTQVSSKILWESGVSKLQTAELNDTNKYDNELKTSSRVGGGEPEVGKLGSGVPRVSGEREHREARSGGWQRQHHRPGGLR